MLFGCRLFAAMPSEPQAEGIDRFIKSCLTGDGAVNSLKQQTQVRNQTARAKTWEDMIFDGVNVQGSGLVAFRPNDNPFVYRSTRSVLEDSRYRQKVNKSSQQPFSVLMAHVRAGPNPVIQNNHPFIDRQNRWAFMHNGNIPRQVLENYRQTVEREDLFLTGETLKGTTDSEVAFNRILGHMMRLVGTTDPARIDSDTLMKVFGRTLREIINLADWSLKDTDFHKLEPMMVDRLNEVGLKPAPDASIKFLPALNFVISDGNRILASCYKQKLWLNVYRLPDGATVPFFSSEPIKPAVGKLELQQEIPEGHMVLLEKTAQGVSFSIQAF